MKNRNRVPKKQWRKWSARARRVFNEVYGFIYDNPGRRPDRVKLAEIHQQLNNLKRVRYEWPAS